MTDASIPLSYKPIPLADPLEQQGKVLNLLAMRQHLQMAPIQLQEAQEQLKAHQIANQEAALKQRDDVANTQSYQAAGGDPDKHVSLFAQSGARPQAVQDLQKHYAGLAEQKAKTGKDQLEVEKYRNDQMLGLHDQAIGMLQENPEAFAQQWPTLYATAAKIDPETAKHFDPATPPTLDQIQQSKLAHVTHDYLIKQADEQRKADTDKRAQEEWLAKKPGVVAEASRQVLASQTGQLQADAAKLAAAAAQGPAALAAAKATIPADRLQPFGDLTDPTEIARTGLTPDQRVTTQLTGDRNKAIAENERRMRSIAEGNLGVAREHADIAKKIYEQTYGEGANPALTGVLPAQRNAALSAAQKAADEFGKGAESLANVQTFIDMAKRGNKAAGSNLPIMGAESIQALNGIRRINRTEIEQYQGAGSLLDRIQGRLGGLVSGQPIPKDVMADIEALHKAIGENAATTYNTKLDGINQNYHSNFKPVAGRKPAGVSVPAEVQAALKSAGPGIHTLSDGSKWMTDASGNITKQ